MGIEMSPQTNVPFERVGASIPYRIVEPEASKRLLVMSLAPVGTVMITWLDAVRELRPEPTAIQPEQNLLGKFTLMLGKAMATTSHESDSDGPSRNLEGSTGKIRVPTKSDLKHTGWSESSIATRRWNSVFHVMNRLHPDEVKSTEETIAFLVANGNFECRELRVDVSDSRRSDVLPRMEVASVDYLRDRRVPVRKGPDKKGFFRKHN